MIAVTNQEEAFAKVTPVSAVEEINGEYYVDSAASVTFTEMERSIDRLRKKYSAAAEEDIQFISANKVQELYTKGFIHLLMLIKLYVILWHMHL